MHIKVPVQCVGVRQEIRHLIHIKVMRCMLYDHALFNCLSMDKKPSRKGGAKPRPKQYHPAPQGLPFTIKCSLATGCPPEAHNQSQLKHPASSRPKCTQTLQDFSAAPPTQELTLFPMWAEQYSLITLQTIVTSLRASRPHRRTVPH